MEITRDFVQQLSRRLQGKLNFIQVVLGPRQVGKTTGVKQLFDHWQGPKHMVSADLLVPPDNSWIVEHWNRAASFGKGALLIIDEIQKVPRWSEAVKMLFDQDRKEAKLFVVLLGSASLALEKGISDSLAGRFELLRVPHWSLFEMKSAFGFGLEEYLKFGGYPAPAEYVNDPIRWQSLMRDSIIEPVLSRDILALSAVAKPALFRQSFELAMSYPAQVIALTKLLGELQERGNVSTIKHYLELFQSAFLLALVPKYSTRKLTIRAATPKIVPLAPALIQAFHASEDAEISADWRGRLLEAAIGAHLYSYSNGNLFYWSEGDYEVDYVLVAEKKVYAIEVKSGRKRRATSMQKFLRHFPKAIPVEIDWQRGAKLLERTDIMTNLIF